MNAVIALINAMLLTSAITVAPTVTRGWGFGMMDESETAASQNKTPEALFAQNQANCLKPLNDNWWSPIAGPVEMKVCGPPTSVLTPKTQVAMGSPSLQTPASIESKAETQPTTESSTTSAPPSQTGASTPPPDMTETKDREGNTVLSSSSQATTVTVVVPKDSSQEEKYTNMGLAEGVQKGIELAKVQEKNDYNRGLLEGVKYALHLGEEAGNESKKIQETQSKYTPEQISQYQSLEARSQISKITEDLVYCED